MDSTVTSRTMARRKFGAPLPIRWVMSFAAMASCALATTSAPVKIDSSVITTVKVRLSPVLRSVISTAVV